MAALELPTGFLVCLGYASVPEVPLRGTSEGAFGASQVEGNTFTDSPDSLSYGD